MAKKFYWINLFLILIVVYLSIKNYEEWTNPQPRRKETTDTKQKAPSLTPSAPSAGKEEAYLRLGNGVGVAGKVKIDDRCNHHYIDDQAQCRNNGMLDGVKILPSLKGNDRPDTGEAVKDKSPEV